MIRFDFDLILLRFGFDLVLIWICLDFDSIWLDFCWIRLDFGFLAPPRTSLESYESYESYNGPKSKPNLIKILEDNSKMIKIMTRNPSDS